MNTGNHDLLSISLFSMGICVVALNFGFTVFRENRLAEGVSYKLWEGVSPAFIFIFIVLFAVILVSILLHRFISWYPVLSVVLGNLFIICIFLALADSTHYLTSAAAEYSRVSLGSGAWLLLLGGYILTLSALKGIQPRLAGTIITFLAVIVLLALGAAGEFNRLSLVQELIAKKGRFLVEFFNHISLAFTSVGFAMLIGIPLGILAYRKKKVEKTVFYFVNTAQTIPSLALFGLLIAPLSFLSAKFTFLKDMGIQGTGTTPAIIALTLYALLPITRNIHISLKAVDPAFIQAGKGMGFSRLQLLLTVEIPLAAPILLNGIRLAAVQAIGNTTIAALIGAGGFGFFIFQGLGQAATDLILLGAIPVVILAVFVDRIMQAIIRFLTPEGIQLRNLDIGRPG